MDQILTRHAPLPSLTTGHHRRRVPTPWIVTGAALAAAAAAAGLRAARRHARPPTPRREAVTVAVDMDRLTAATDIPAPLRHLSEHAEVRYRTAPAGRGTEIHVTALPDGSTLDLRAELRAVKQLLEVGEVLRVEPRPAAHRGPAARQVTALMGRMVTRGGPR
jgi:hypothetical protein